MEGVMARGKGEGSVSKDARTGLWVGRVELPSYDYDDNGKPIRRRKVIRRKDKAELIRELNALRKRLHESGDIPTASMTVEAWVTYWVRDIAPKTRRQSTMSSYRSVVGTSIIPGLGKIRLEQLTATHVRTFMTRVEQTAAPTTARNTFSILSAALADAERGELISRNPCDLVTRPRKGRPELEVLSVGEVKGALVSFSASPELVLWSTYLLTGARRSEIIGLEWDRVGESTIDLSWQLQRLLWSHGCGPRPAKGKAAACGYRRAASCPERWVETPNDFEYRRVAGGLYWTRPKSRAGWRVIPLVEPLRSMLAEWRAVAPDNPHGLVFTKGPEPIDPNNVSKVWLDVRAAVGIDRRVRVHDLRHTAIDMMYDAGASEADIIRIFGHSTVQMSRSYRSRGDGRREAAAMTLASSYLGLLGIES